MSLTVAGQSVEHPLDWARDSWWVLHYVLKNRKFANEDEVQAFLDHFSKVLVCPPCHQHFDRMVRQQPFPTRLIGVKKPTTPWSEELFRWSVERHNQVNARLGKPELSLDEAQKLYCASCHRSAQDLLTNAEMLRMLPDPLWRFLLRIHAPPFNEEESFREGRRWLMGHLQVWLPSGDLILLERYLHEQLLGRGNDLPFRPDDLDQRLLLDACNQERRMFGNQQMLQLKTLPRYSMGGCGVAPSNRPAIVDPSSGPFAASTPWILGSLFAGLALALAIGLGVLAFQSRPRQPSEVTDVLDHF